VEKVFFVAHSFEEADLENARQNMALTPVERLNIVESPRRMYNPDPPLLERVLRVVELGED
jgi:hypothetical protein